MVTQTDIESDDSQERAESEQREFRQIEDVKPGARGVTSGAFVTITVGKIKEGKLEEFKTQATQIVEMVQEHEPRVIAFHTALTEDQSQVLGMQFHPDAASMEFHLKVLSEKIEQTGSLLDIQEFKVLGEASEPILGMMDKLADAGVKVQHMSQHLLGFTRSSAAE